MEVFDNSCLKCSLLGNTTNTYPLFYTVSPDPYILNYGEKLPKGQKNFIDSGFKTCLSGIKKYYDVKYATVHYELNKAGNLHIHGIIGLDESYSDYELHQVIIQKIFHKEFGRPGIASAIAGKTEWVKNLYDTCSYLNKSNVFPSIHHIPKKEILEENGQLITQTV